MFNSWLALKQIFAIWLLSLLLIATPKSLDLLLSQILSSIFAQLRSYFIPETKKWHLSVFNFIYVIVYKPKDR